jgi:hypothetical protein
VSEIGGQAKEDAWAERSGSPVRLAWARRQSDCAGGYSEGGATGQGVGS